jgi:hypothetical protein
MTKNLYNLNVAENATIVAKEALQRVRTKISYLTYFNFIKEPRYMRSSIF